MNFLDLIILLPIAFLAYRGFVNGFFKEVFGIIGIILAVYLTFEYMGTISPIVAPYVENRDRATIVTGIVMFICIVLAVQFTAYALERFFQALRLGIINKVAGMIFGALKSAIVISAVLLLFAGIGIPDEEATRDSVSYPVIIYVAPAAFDVIASIFPGTEDFIETIERTIQDENSLRNLPIFENLDLIDR